MIFTWYTEHDFNSVLGFENYYSTLAENLLQILPKPLNKYSTNTVIKYYQIMIQGDHFDLTSVSEKNSILTILKANQVWKALLLSIHTRNWSTSMIKLYSDIILQTEGRYWWWLSYELSKARHWWIRTFWTKAPQAQLFMEITFSKIFA